MKGSLWTLEQLSTEIKLRLFSFIHKSLIIKRKDDSEGIKPQRAEPTAMENNSQRVEMSPTHRTDNMYLAGIQNFYGPVTALCL